VTTAESGLEEAEYRGPGVPGPEVQGDTSQALSVALSLNLSLRRELTPFSLPVISLGMDM
jgi:hypothetical protein